LGFFTKKAPGAVAPTTLESIRR